MTSLPGQIDQLRTHFLEEMREILTTRDLESLKTKYFGKKGLIQAFLQDLKNQAPEQRPHFGKLINDLKEELLAHCDATLARLQNQEMMAAFQEEEVDVTLPGRSPFLGRAHPIHQ